MGNKEVQVIPWVTKDAGHFVEKDSREEGKGGNKNALPHPSLTVFVGALHGMLTAKGLVQIFEDLFGNVVYASIDTDKFKYPIGSGKVCFSDKRSFVKAVRAAFIEIKTGKFNKKVHNKKNHEIVVLVLNAQKITDLAKN
jgi:cytoplasmic polyadenylation element-binding protein